MPDTGDDKIVFAIDRGGTFTDVVAVLPQGEVTTTKVLSVSPLYADAPSEGIRHVLAATYGTPVNRPIPTEHIAEIRMGTTVATNALLERKGARVVLIVTKGFGDLLEIGTQARPDLFALNIKKPSAIAERVIEVNERMQLTCDPTSSKWIAAPIIPLDVKSARVQLQTAFDDGIRSVAISLVHAFANDAHEKELASIAAEIGFTTISSSAALVPMIKYYPRTMTAVVNAYLAPVVKEYVRTFKSQFVNDCDGVPVLFMQSDGGLVPSEAFDAFRAVLSGPAGGVVGCCRCGVQAFGADVPIIGFDMGGTSTDVCRCVQGKVEMVTESEVAGARMQFPQVDVNTVAAGGGSILEWRDGMFTVGPHSAGALPGPMCYGRGGPLTITDANVMLGRIQPWMLPRLFGKNGDEAIDPTPVIAAFEALTVKINEDSGVKYSAARVAQSFVDIANEQMCRPIRTLTEGRGYRCQDHGLVCFGGAGGQHAVEIARKLAINQVFVPRYASVLSAVGIGAASIVRERILPWGGPLSADTFGDLIREVRRNIDEEREQNAAPDRDEWIPHFSLRFEGTATVLSIECSGDLDAVHPDNLKMSFEARHKVEFGFALQRKILIDNVRLRSSSGSRTAFLNPNGKSGGNPRCAGREHQCDAVNVVFGSRTEKARVVDTLESLDSEVHGPALLLCEGSTVVLDSSSTARIDNSGNVMITLTLATHPASPCTESSTVDPRLLTVFAHRFMSIAEQMGRALQQTAVSTNIKERLDFSCAIFDSEAGLVANAPHIPVHLGAMGATVKYQMEKFKDNWADDDVVVCNHPARGGSHLPDITVISPVVVADLGRVGYVACRAHHADIGGLTPGSMPPFSTKLEEEGAIIEGSKLVRHGVFDEEGITKILMAPAEVTGCAGCRALHDVLSDLRAQVAANHKGIVLLTDLVRRESLLTVTNYMRHLQDAAAAAVADLIAAKVAAASDSRDGHLTLRCEDQMDDGTPVCLTISLDASKGRATFDFTGTGRQVYGSTNCPPQVVRSAVLYSLRCLLNNMSTTLPLNEGCMRPVEIILPPKSILCPSPDAAIVAGNVLTSQRITDVILCAFDACACAQGDMNNLTFGDESHSYYETVCGGSGGGPGFDGADAVHTHMTNTRITDVEWLESRFPVMLKQFRVRTGSGGTGKYRGGCGVVRSFLFLNPMVLCILSERRSVAPRGLHDGGNGSRGINLLLRAASSTDLASALQQDCEGPEAISVGGKATVALGTLDTFTMLTPGGGAFGRLI
jgi:5-oxoprolinase (ATP-hydrolysing)